MALRKYTIVLISLLLVAACVPKNAVEEELVKIAGPKYRIAVVEFRDEFSGVGGTAAGTGSVGHDVWNAYVELLNKAAREGGDKRGVKTVGAGAAKMLETALMKCGNFELYTRKELDKVLKEQALGQSGMVTPQSAAKAGKLIGVNAIVIGTVTEFGEKKSKTRVSGNTMQALTGRRKGWVGLLAAGGLGFSKAKARVVIDVQLIDTTTGRIILAESATGEESSMGVSIAGVSTGSSIDDTKVGKALRKSIHKLTNAISKEMATIPWSARIVKVRGKYVYINAGRTSDITKGMVFEIYRKGEELVDPSTGESLGFEETLAGEAQAFQILNRATKALVTTGSGFRRGDIIRLKPGQDQPPPPAKAAKKKG